MKRKRLIIDTSNNIKIFRIIFPFAVLITCTAVISFGQDDSQYNAILDDIIHSGAFDVSAIPQDAQIKTPVECDRQQLTPEMRQHLMDSFKERIVLMIKNKWYRPWKVDDAIVSELAKVYSEGVLEPTIVAIFQDPRMQKLLPQDTHAPYPPEEIARTFAMYIGAELESHGHVPGVPAVEPWDEMTQRHLSMAQSRAYPSRKKDQPTLLAEAGFVTELETLQKAGFHSKILLTDGKYAILGGMNIGDEYSHLNPKSEHWRDTDIFVQGPVIKDAMGFFAGAWNEQVQEQGLIYQKIFAGNYNGTPAGNAEASIILNNPGQEPYILLSTLKAIYGATKRINIENAIIVMMPSIREAILDARRRGVEVNILTNSFETIGDKIMSSMVLSSFPDLMKAGVNVYLKTGYRLHSKFMTVDGVYGTVGSFNIQPRSVRYVMEITVNFFDADAVKNLDRDFEKDISHARKAEKIKDLDIPFVPIKNLVRKYMFNQL